MTTEKIETTRALIAKAADDWDKAETAARLQIALIADAADPRKLLDWVNRAAEAQASRAVFAHIAHILGDYDDNTGWDAVTDHAIQFYENMERDTWSGRVNDFRRTVADAQKEAMRRAVMMCRLWLR